MMTGAYGERILKDVENSIEGIQYCDWTFRSCKRNILNSEELEDWMKTLHVKNLPEMVFGHNYLQLSYKNGLTFRFNAFDALRRVDHDGDISQVSYAEEWTASKSATLDSGEIQMDTLKYDWSFTTDYQGTIITPDIMQPEERILTPPKSDFSSNDTGENSETENLPRIGEPLECNEKIDFHMLKTRDPILFFSEIHLYEDELSDNGISLMSVKIVSFSFRFGSTLCFSADLFSFAFLLEIARDASMFLSTFALLATHRWCSIPFDGYSMVSRIWLRLSLKRDSVKGELI